MLLSLTNITIGYGKKAVVSGISAEIEPGQLVCLAGRNGSGKSTLMKTIAQFQPALAGTITIGGSDIKTISRTEMAKTVGIVLTERPDAQDMTVRAMVALGRSPHTGFLGRLQPADHAIVEAAMGTIGIAHLEGRLVAELSDGERQKVMIAKALAQQTPIILLDEPTAFLDFQSKVELMQTLQHLAHDERKIVLFSSHDLQLALDMADAVWLFRDNGGTTTLSIHQPPLDEATIIAFAGDTAARYLIPKN